MQAVIRQWWNWAIGPVANSIEPETRVQARLVNALLLVFILVISLLTLFVLLIPDDPATVQQRVASLMLIDAVAIGIYGFLGRRGYYTQAVHLLIALSTLIIIGSAVAEQSVRTLYYLSLLVLLGGVFLSVAAALITAAVQVALLLALAVWYAPIPADGIISGPLTYTLLVLAFTVFVARYRTQTRVYRQQLMIERDRAYEHLVENLTDIICTLTSQGQVVRANRAITAETGWSLGSFTGQLFAEFVHPDERAVFVNACEMVAQGAGGAYCEVRVQAKDGHYRWWDIKMTPYSDGKGDFLILCIARDITDRKATEAALRASENKFMTAFRANPDSININRVSDGLYIEINEGFTRIMGYTREDIIGRTALEMNIWADPADRQRMVEGLQTQGQVANLEARFIDKYGQVHIGLMSARVIEVDGELCAINITRDVTEQKRMEAYLRDSEERYRMISNLISDFAFSVQVKADGSYGMDWMTEESFATITGYSLAEIVSDPQQVFHPEDLGRLNADLVAMIAANQPSEGDYRMVRKNGEVRWLRITRRPVWDDAEGRVVRYYGAAQDITPLKLAEAERIKRVLQAEQTSMTGRFVLAISHDFRTALSIIETSRYLIERLLDEAQRATAQPKLERIHEAVQHMADQLDNLTRASALTEPQMQPTALYPLLDALVHKHRPAAAKKDLNLHFDVARDLPPVTCNGDDIQRAVEHLLTNALQFTETGEINLQAGLDAAGTHMLITVSDTGPGIAPEHLPQIFDYFFRVDPSRRVSAGGVGLGLSLVRLIARAHNGTVDVESTPGVGSTFTLRLPLTQEAYPASLVDLPPYDGA